MMKKWMLFAFLAAVCVPAFAQGPRDCKGDNCPAKQVKAETLKPAKMKKDARAEEFKKARREHKAKMRATEGKMEKLVEEYNKLKAGKKKDAKKAEIAEMVASIREEQIKFKEEQLTKFQERLERMKKDLEEQKSDKSKKEWVEQKTDAVIAEEGDLDVLFEPEMGPAPHRMPGPKGAPKAKGPRRGPAPHGGPALPPPPVEEPAK